MCAQHHALFYLAKVYETFSFDRSMMTAPLNSQSNFSELLIFFPWRSALKSP